MPVVTTVVPVFPLATTMVAAVVATTTVLLDLARVIYTHLCKISRFSV
jgi:hypothetical protein